MRSTFAVVVFVFLFAGLSSGQSLGEVAAKEKERREKNAENDVSTKAFTSSGGRIAAIDKDGPETATPGKNENEEKSGSLWDAEREKAKVLEPQMAEIARVADELDILFERYVNECQGRYTITPTPGPAAAFDPTQSYDVRFGRGWLIVLENPTALATTPAQPGRDTVSTAQTPACQKLRSEVVVSATWVKAEMEELLEEARKEGILPGMVRELREKYRIEWSRYKI